MPSYKLTYFNGRGRAEGCRLLFALAGVEFEDKRVTSEEWQKLKPNTRFGQLPIMEIDGEEFAQSSALLCYLAREFGYYGKTNKDALAIDQVLGLVEDFVKAAIKAHFVPEDKKEEMAKDFKDNAIPKFMTFLEKLLTDSGTGYYVGSSVTVADVSVFDFVSGVESHHPGITDNYPKVKALLGKVASLDKIKAYLEKRPVTEF